jgi:hypothetical protein
MAAGADEGDAKIDGAQGLDAVEGVLGRVFGLDDAALAGAHIAADESSGHLLIDGGVGEEVAGQLLGGELIERLVPVERFDHPLAVGPDIALGIDMVSVGIGVAHGIQPFTRHILAVAR